ncbi:hypothetical protein ACWD3J_49495 [Streptomyces sp. NPDC002755]|uniref:hypothetical protein n=1 Tax=Streptomyces sp. NPDC002884 TaxID=3154544 RepID=UPI0033194F8D
MNSAGIAERKRKLRKRFMRFASAVAVTAGITAATILGGAGNASAAIDGSFGPKGSVKLCNNTKFSMWLSWNNDKNTSARATPGNCMLAQLNADMDLEVQAVDTQFGLMHICRTTHIDPYKAFVYVVSGSRALTTQCAIRSKSFGG